MADEMCTRGTPPCGKPLDTDGSPKWCRACRAKYRREYEDSKEGRAAAKGYAEGARAMREAIAASASAMPPTIVFSGAQIAHYVRKMEPPDQSA